jgi:hypothetical protein
LVFAGSLGLFLSGTISAMLGTLLPTLSARAHLTPEQNGNMALGDPWIVILDFFVLTIPFLGQQHGIGISAQKRFSLDLSSRRNDFASRLQSMKDLTCHWQRFGSSLTDIVPSWKVK